MERGHGMNYYDVDDEKAREKAAAKATDEVRKTFPDTSSDAANTLWLEVFWREYKRMVSP